VAELPPGYAENSPEERKKAKTFFSHGNTVAGTGNYDYAISMYIDGLVFDPDCVEAHQILRDISLKRKASGGKSTGMFEAMKLKRPTKDDKQNMLNNEKLLAFDPGNTDHMVGVLQNALRAGFYDTVMWLGPILQQANADSPKPEVGKFIILRDAYKTLKQWKKATDACHYAAMLRPDDMDLQKELKDLGAMDTMDAGKYGTSSSFRESIKDMDGQSKLMVQDKDVRTMDQMSRLIHDAEAEWKADPQDPGKIMKFVEILAKTEQAEQENRAIDLLQDTFDRSKQFRFRMAIGRIRMAQLSRMERTMRQAVQANPSDAQAKQDYAQFVQEQVNEELKEYQLAAENYPTEANLRYQVAIRLSKLQKYDEAIPILQHVRQDPKLRTDASVALGKAFLDAGFADEAVDTLGTVIGDYVNKGDKRSIEMTYLYGRALEQKGDAEAAKKAYSQVTQWDFNYRDTQARLKKLREKPAATEG
jgi:hypothetical protein